MTATNASRIQKPRFHLVGGVRGLAGCVQQSQLLFSAFTVHADDALVPDPRDARARGILNRTASALPFVERVRTWLEQHRLANQMQEDVDGQVVEQHSGDSHVALCIEADIPPLHAHIHQQVQRVKAKPKDGLPQKPLVRLLKADDQMADKVGRVEYQPSDGRRGDGCRARKR